MTKQILMHVRAMLILMASRWLSYSFRQNAAAGMSYNNTRTNHQDYLLSVKWRCRGAAVVPNVSTAVLAKKNSNYT